MAEGEDSPKKDWTWDFLLPVLGVIGTGVGVAGLVAFAGGVVLWARFARAGLPAEEAVALVPNTSLVAFGAHFLVPAFLLALLAVALLYLFNSGRGVLVARRTEHLSRAAYAAAERGRVSEAKAAAARGLARRQAALLDDMGQVSSPGTIRAFKSAFQSASEPEADAAKDKAELDRLRAEAFAERTADLSRRERITQAGILFGLLCLGQVVTAQLFWLGLGIAKTLLFVLLAVATAAIALAVFLQTRQFRWFACAAFLSVSFFIVALTYVRTTDSLKVPPAAMLRNGQTPMLGWFVAQTSDRVYLADARRGPVSHRIVAVPRSQVTDLAIGALVPFDRAHMRAVELATELCAIPRAVPTGDQSSSRPSRLNPKNCSMQEIRRLRRLMAELRMERRDE